MALQVNTGGLADVIFKTNPLLQTPHSQRFVVVLKLYILQLVKTVKSGVVVFVYKTLKVDPAVTAIEGAIQA